MDLRSLEGFEELFSDGVINPEITSPVFQSESKKYKKLTERVFLLYEPTSKEPEFDIVLVHGIGSDEFKCWSTEKGLLWPAAFIPQDFPTARVLTVGYEHSLWNWKSVEEKEEAKGKRSGSKSEKAKKGNTVQETPKEGLVSVSHVSEKIESSLKSWWGDGNREKAPVPTTKDSSANSPGVEQQQQQRRRCGPLQELLVKEQSGFLPLESTSGAKLDDNSQSLRSFRRVGADIADRLVSAEVGVGRRPVVFITHSMGGLITKEMLVALFQSVSSASSWRSNKDRASHPDPVGPAEKALQQAAALLQATRGVVFYGTPHFGSGIASVVTGLQRYYQSLGGLTPTNVVTGLGDHNREALRLLNDRFMEVVERVQDHSDCPTTKEEAGVRTVGDRRAANMSILSFGETRKLNGLVRVVEPESANPCPDDPRFSFYLIDADHCQVNRPETKTSPSYAMLYGFLDRLQQKGELGGRQAELLLETLPVVSTTAEGKQTATHAPIFTEEEWQSLIEASRSTVRAQAEKIDSNAQHGELKYLSTYYSRYPPQTTFLMLQELENALAELRRTMGRFFGCVVPPELDGILLLGTDVREFTFSSFGPLARQTETSASLETLAQSFLLSVTLPCHLLLYWARYTNAMIISMERRQLERTVALMTTAILPAGSVIPHLSSEDTRDLAEVEREVNVLKGEWESFRHSISVRLRRHRATGGGVALWEQLSGKERWLTEQHLHVLFFMQSVRSVLTKEIHDGGCLSDLVGHYLKVVFKRVSHYESEVLQSTFSELVPSEKTTGNLLSDDRASSSGGSPFTFVFTEGLETYLSLGVNDDRARDVPVPSQESNACVLPALSAASCFMLGYIFSINGGAYFSSHHLTSRSHYRHALASLRSWRSSMNQLDSRIRAQATPKNAPSWWDSGKERREKDRKLWERNKYDSDVLTSAFELVTHTFLTLSYWQEAEDGGGMLSFVNCSRETVGWRPLGEHAQLAIKEAQRAYTRCDCLLRGDGIQDLNRPFSPAIAAEGSDAFATSSTRSKSSLGGGQQGEANGTAVDVSTPGESLTKVKEAFLESLRGFLSEMDHEEEEGSPATKQQVSKKAKSNSTFSASSIPSFFINSLVNAWDAVRRGGEVPETPKYFAQNALLFWWVVEEHWRYSFEQALHLSSRNAGPQGAFLQTAYADFLKTKQAPPQAGVASSTNTIALQQAMVHKHTNNRIPPQETYQSSHNCLRSQWATACGYGEVADVWRKLYFGEIKSEEEKMRVARAMGPSRIPVALTRALELDRGNALAHCLVGNFLVLRDGLSPDAAHPYHAVLRIEKSPRQPLYRAAAATLGWLHLRQVNTAVPFRLSNMGGERDLLVQDPLAQRSVSGPYQQFLETVLAQVRARTVVPEDTRQPASFLPLWQEVTTYHLDLAEQYFSTVLQEDPEHTGALCGLGRLHTLAVDAPHEACGRGSLSASRYASIAPRLVGRVPHFDLAGRYFHAALGGTPLETKRSSTADRMLDAMFASFAAHWLGDLARPDLLTGQQHPHAATPAQLNEQVGELQSARDDCEKWYRQSLALFPMNDWTLTSLGLLKAQGYHVSDPQHREGLDLLEKSLLLNPRNEWTQWALAVYGGKESLRLSSAASLQQTLMKSLFRAR